MGAEIKQEWRKDLTIHNRYDSKGRVVPRYVVLSLCSLLAFGHLFKFKLALLCTLLFHWLLKPALVMMNV